MIIIAHRGLVEGPNAELENLPNTIDNAIALGYSVEVDVWKIRDIFYLSHDEPADYDNLDQTRVVTRDFLYDRNMHLYIHCKNVEALEYFTNPMEKITHYTCFWHEDDTYTMTSSGQIIAYPGVQVTGAYTKNAICMKPELAVDGFDCTNFTAICTAYANDYNFLHNE